MESTQCANSALLAKAPGYGGLMIICQVPCHVFLTWMKLCRICRFFLQHESSLIVVGSTALLSSRVSFQGVGLARHGWGPIGFSIRMLATYSSTIPQREPMGAGAFGCQR